jgi:hypothetical protein
MFYMGARGEDIDLNYSGMAEVEGPFVFTGKRHPLLY